MFPENYILYIQLLLFLFITPGPPRVVIVSHTINYGLKRSVWTAVGDVTANTVQATLVTFVIGSLLIDNPKIFTYLKWTGILYILYLAYETFNIKTKSINSKNKYYKSIFSFFKDGFLVAGLSPKALLVFATIFIQFINFKENVFSQFLVLTITWVILDFSTLMIYGLAAGKIRDWLKGNPRFLNTISACVLIVIAVYVAVTQSF